MIEYRENALTPRDHVRLRAAAGWGATPAGQSQRALKGSLFHIVAVDDGRVVGMGRLVGDGAMNWYIQDVIVDPAYQGRGIGREIVRRLVGYVRAHTPPGTHVQLGLMAAKGKEGFYEKLGFTARPRDRRGPGMEMGLAIPDEDM